MRARYDFAVIGAGIAGASVAAELAADASVLLLDKEPQPSYHSTGRSATYFSASYGSAAVRAPPPPVNPSFDHRLLGSPRHLC